MKKRSFIRNLSIMLFMQFVLLTALFVALIVHMRNSAVTEMETAADNVLAIYRVNLENRIERANNILKNLTLSEETALEMIRSDKESDRYYAKKSIYTAMHAALLQDNAVDLLIVAENSYGGYMESTNGDSSKWALHAVRDEKSSRIFHLEVIRKRHTKKQLDNSRNRWRTIFIPCLYAQWAYSSSIHFRSEFLLE